MKAALAILALAMTLAAWSAEPSARAKTNTVARITAASTYYDRKEGVAVFTGNVFVDDDEYKMHADKAFVFIAPTNELKRIVAVGHVALTNGLRRAYGGKATYRRDNGLVTLYATSDDEPAEVREEKAEGAQVLKGKKIRVWLDSEQIEVEGVDISTPVGSTSGMLPGAGLGEKEKKKKDK